MSLECSECERDVRGSHDPSCSRYDVADEIRDAVDDGSPESGVLERAATEIARLRADVERLRESIAYHGRAAIVAVMDDGEEIEIPAVKFCNEIRLRASLDGAGG